MGILDKIGAAMKKVADATKNFAEDQAKQMKYRSEVQKLKLQLLLRFTKDQLEKVAAMYRVSLYVHPDPFAERTVRLRSKADIAEHLSKKLYYNEIIDAARRFKIPFADIEEEKERIYREIFGNEASSGEGNADVQTYEQNTVATSSAETAQATANVAQQQVAQTQTDPYVTAMWQLKELLEHEFEPQPVRDEAEFKAQVLQYLVAKVGRDAVAQEVMLGGRKVDLVLWQAVAVELKLARGQQALTNLLGECLKLKRAQIPYVMAIILDVGKYRNLHHDVRDLEELGIMVAVVKGRLKQSRKRKITVEM